MLYVGPLKALITDQAGRLDMICDGAGLPVTPWHGDVAQSVKARALKAPRGILLITPESLEALFVRRGSEIPRLFAATRAVVLDELHTMLDSERGVQLRALLTGLDWRAAAPCAGWDCQRRWANPASPAHSYAPITQTRSPRSRPRRLGRTTGAGEGLRDGPCTGHRRRGGRGSGTVRPPAGRRQSRIRRDAQAWCPPCGSRA